MTLRFEIEDATRVHRLDVFKDLAAAARPLVTTLLLIAANAGVYAAMVAKGVSPVSPTADALLHWGANHEPLVRQGEAWRLLTSMFVHVGIVHLVMNMTVLWSAGRIMEPMFGRLDFLLLYVLTGLAGSLTSIAVHPLTVSAGASGAIFGLFGGLTGAVVARRASMPTEMRVRLLKYALTFTMVNFVYGLTQKNIDMSAHVGGFFAGVPIGIALLAQGGAAGGAPLWRKAVVTVSVVALQAAGAMRLPVIDDWLGELRRVTDLDTSSVAVHNAAVKNAGASALSREEFGRVVDGLLVPWEKERAKLSSLRLPAAERLHAESLGRYMSLKAEAWRLEAAGVRNHDAAAIRSSSLKEESALLALKGYASDTDLATRLDRLRAQRAAVDARDAQAKAAQLQQKSEADAFLARLKRVNVAEKDSIKTINDALARMRVREMSHAEVADLIEARVLPQWSRQRVELGQAEAPKGQTELLINLLRYMVLKDESWSLLARALRTDNARLVQEQRSKEAEANRLAAAMTHANGRGVSLSHP